MFMILDDSDKDTLLHFLMTVLHHHESHTGDFSALVLASYSDFELSPWSKEHVEVCLEIQSR